MKINLKSNHQINQIKDSCKITSDTIFYLADFIKPGISTEEINVRADEFIQKAGAISACLNYHGYPKSICTSINEVICHGIPSEKETLKDGDIIGVDVSTIKDGFFGDACFTFPVGNVVQETMNLLRTCREALSIGIRQVLPNGRIGDIGYAINEYITKKGYSVVYEYVGHGVGIEFHEEPNIPHVALKGVGPKIVPRMIFTCEPMINFGCPETIVDESDGWTVRTKDKKMSAQYEHTVLVTETGNEVLTILPDYILNNEIINCNLTS
jgi:methionyl aminopeptidase